LGIIKRFQVQLYYSLVNFFLSVQLVLPFCLAIHLKTFTVRCRVCLCGFSPVCGGACASVWCVCVCERKTFIVGVAVAMFIFCFNCCSPDGQLRFLAVSKRNHPIVLFPFPFPLSGWFIAIDFDAAVYANWRTIGAV